jgi:hypothetical protein
MLEEETRAYLIDPEWPQSSPTDDDDNDDDDRGRVDVAHDQEARR